MSELRRDLVGYGNKRLHFSWPGGRRLAISLVVNFEEGSEHSVATDGIVEGVGEFLPVDIKVRDIGNESSYEYGSRVGTVSYTHLLSRSARGRRSRGRPS